MLNNMTEIYENHNFNHRIGPIKAYAFINKFLKVSKTYRSIVIWRRLVLYNNKQKKALSLLNQHFLMRINDKN